ncbi:hypothetical protein EBU95_02105 [bacterium]|nr:hypothetical protein [bacterium]
MGGLYFAVYNDNTCYVDNSFTNAFMRMKARGADETTLVTDATPPINQINQAQAVLFLSKREIANYKQIKFTYGYHHTKINDTTDNYVQPFVDPILHKARKYPEIRMRPLRKLMCNGEIYNYNELVASEKFCDRDLQTTSDVEIILPMYIKHGLEYTLANIEGDYSFVLTESTNTFDTKSINAFVARDPVGMRSLYCVKKKCAPGSFFYLFVSELKSIPDHVISSGDWSVLEVPPGCYWSLQNVLTSNTPEFIRYHDMYKLYGDLTGARYTLPTPEQLDILYTNVSYTLTNAVTKRCNLSSVPFGVLLAGFDSCAILQIVCKSFPSAIVHAFTIGDNDEQDTLTATMCVEYLKERFPRVTLHHHVIGIHTPKLLEDTLQSIAYTLESDDPLTVQQSLPFNFLMKYIKQNTDIKVLLSGEGLDELLTIHSGSQDAQQTLIDNITNIYKRDILRNDKIAGLYNLEVRHPYLDTHFIDLMMSVHPRLKTPQKYDYTKNPIDKYIVRKAFDIDNSLPYQVLWARSKCISKCIRRTV